MRCRVITSCVITSLVKDHVSEIESERPVHNIRQLPAEDHISPSRRMGTTERISSCTALRPSCDEGDTQLQRVRQAAAGSNSRDGVCQGEATVEIPAEFERMFEAALQYARKSFTRQCIRRPKCKVPREIMRYGEEIISRYINKKPRKHSEFRWLNILTYAAGVGISTTTRKVRKSKSFIMRAKEWFKNKIKERAHLQKLLHRIRLEVTGKRERRRPNKSERSNISALRLGLGSRCCTAKLIRSAVESKMRVKILNNRIELRKDDTNTRTLRLRFAAQPSLKPLILKDNEIDKSPLQDKIVKFWTPIVGDKKETYPKESEELEN